MTNKYCGWIPCVSGRLSFSIIGKGLDRKPKWLSNHLWDGKKNILVAQMKYGSDTPFKYLKILGCPIGEHIGQLIGRWRHKQDRTALFLLEARLIPAKNDDVLMGFISTWPSRKSPQDEIINRERSLNSDKKEYSCVYNVSRNADWKFFFKLHKNGIIELKNVFRGIARHADIERIKTAREQAYMFIRDATHTHKHHSASHDVLTMIFEDNQSKPWQIEVMKRLFRFTISVGRSDKWAQIASAKGILAYTRSFQEIVEAETTNSQILEKYGPIKLSNYLDSQTVKQERRLQEKERTNWGLGLSISMTLAFLAYYKDDLWSDYPGVVITAWLLLTMLIIIRTNFIRRPKLLDEDISWLGFSFLKTPKLSGFFYYILGLGSLFIVCWMVLFVSELLANLEIF